MDTNVIYSGKKPGRKTTHGDSVGGVSTKEYKCWLSLKSRCTRPQDNAYKDYGARGITVCDRWMESYSNFLLDMGRAPTKKHSIERIDNNLGYTPINCKWATMTEQSNNRRSSRMEEYAGEKRSVSDWCRKLNLHYATITTRIERGWTIQMAFETKINKKG